MFVDYQGLIPGNCAACESGDRICSGCGLGCCPEHFLLSVIEHTEVTRSSRLEWASGPVIGMVPGPTPYHHPTPVTGPGHWVEVPTTVSTEMLLARTARGEVKMPLPRPHPFGRVVWSAEERDVVMAAWTGQKDLCVWCRQQQAEHAIDDIRVRELAVKEHRRRVSDLKGQQRRVHDQHVPSPPAGTALLTACVSVLPAAALGWFVVHLNDQRRFTGLFDEVSQLVAGAMVAAAAVLIVAVLCLLWMLMRLPGYRAAVTANAQAAAERQRLQLQIDALQAQGPNLAGVRADRV